MPAAARRRRGHGATRARGWTSLLRLLLTYMAGEAGSVMTTSAWFFVDVVIVAVAVAGVTISEDGYIIVDEQTAGACTKTSVGGLAWDARVCMCTQDDTACHHGGAGDQVKRSV
ncbi:hypothetical protein J3E74DRAFT_479729 [Bipolaris maydis]|nr:hypothetical protein J3E74DRAFT_479729 [Bipolaris maydis]